MSYDVRVVRVAPTTLASVRERIAWREIGARLPRVFDRVYAFLRAGAVEQAGHNVCVYHCPDGEGAEVEVGVQVASPFPATGEVACSATPAGRAVWTRHLKGYDRLGGAHDALHAYARREGLTVTGPGWEVYGDPGEADRSRTVTEVFLLVAP